MLNWIWLGLILVAVLYGAFAGSMEAVSEAFYQSAIDAIQLVIKLTGGMMFMLGLMRVARDGGLLRAVAGALRPVLRRLFPEVPIEHPAMGAMVMNMASNMLGLGNAATPFGLKAMVELDRLNPHPGTATNAMILFLAINTSAITLMVPTGTIFVRSGAGSQMPDAIWIPTIIATTCSTLVAVGMFFVLRRLRPEPPPETSPEGRERPEDDDLPEVDVDLGGSDEPAGPRRKAFVLAVLLALAAALALEVQRGLATQSAMDVVRGVSQAWLIPLLIAGLLLVGVAGRVRVYESTVQGAREGLDVALRIAPYLVAILVAVAMFRASGALGLLISVLDPLTSRAGFPAEALPMALLRPLSGSGAFGVMAEILETHGPDSFVGLLASTLQGSTETTFYVLVLYLGAARVQNGRFALACCLAGDLAGAIGATFACHLFFGA